MDRGKCLCMMRKLPSTVFISQSMVSLYFFVFAIWPLKELWISVIRMFSRCSFWIKPECRSNSLGDQDTGGGEDLVTQLSASAVGLVGGWG